MQLVKCVQASAGALALSLLTACSMNPVAPVLAPREDVNNSVRSLQSVLDTNPAVESTLLCETPGAKGALIHIRQMHYTHPRAKFSERLRRKYATLNFVQQDIYTMLKDLSISQGIHSVLFEGTAEMNDRQTLVKEYYAVLSTLEQGGFIHPQIPSEKSMTFGEITKELQSRYPRRDGWEEYGFIPGAALVLDLEGVLSVIPAETNKAYSKARTTTKWREFFGVKDPSRNKSVFDVREDGVLKRVGESLSEERIAVVVYGGAHAFGGENSCGEQYSLAGRVSWRDNVNRWNGRNPERKLSLLEVVPKHYAIAYSLREETQSPDTH